MTDPPKGTGPGVYTVTDPPKGTGPGVYTVTNPFGTGTVPKTGPAFLEADRQRIDGSVSRSRVNKRPIRHDFWIGTIWNRSRVNIALVVRFGPVRSDPIRSDPIRSDPIRSDPIRSDPIRSDPGFVNGQLLQEPETLIMSQRLTGGVAAGAVMTLLGQSGREAQRPIDP